MARHVGTIRREITRQGKARYIVDVMGAERRYQIRMAPRGRIWVPLRTEDDALDVLTQIRVDVANGASIDRAASFFLRRPTAATRVPAKLRRFLERERQRMEDGDISPRTYGELERYCRPGGYFSFWEGHHIHQVNFAALEDWRAWIGGRRQKGRGRLGAKTVKNAMGQFRAFLAWLEERGDIDHVPKFPRVPWDQMPPEILTIEAQRAVLDAIPFEDRGIFLACRHTLRPGEARALDLADYRETNLHVHAAMKGQSSQSEIRGAKERNWRVIGADDELQVWLEWRISKASPEERLRKRGVPLFPNRKARNQTRRWTTSTMTKAWNVAARSVGVKVSLYPGTKHTTMTDLARRGVDSKILQRFAGHADRRSTDHYLVLADQDTLDVMRRRK
jgi:integrase